ncbi:cubilin homolog [Teleopsis dalmanni]|uniref:cubilin homolog n=1 Tax=Teleopsis dalmanni TaxID=139649 RepID=UPI0018CEA126|nr:cubilin homolog [Teleopsis dalmanni]
MDKTFVTHWMLYILTIICFNIFISEGLINSPKIITQGGNLIFESGLNRNISIRLNGNSRLKINNNMDLLHFIYLNKKIQHSTFPPETEENLAITQKAMTNLSVLKQRVFGANGFVKSIRDIQNRTRNVNILLRNFQKNLKDVETKVQNIYTRLMTDNCKSNLCENGGTCINMLNGFICTCTKNFERRKFD